MFSEQSQPTKETLVELAQNGSSHALSELILQMLPLIRKKAEKYILPGMDADDLLQECLLGLLKAVRYYDPAQSSFSTFAALCISSHMSSAAKAALSLKSKPLNESVSFEASALPPEDVLPGPEDQLIVREQLAELASVARNRFSKFEQVIFKLYLSGYSYFQIAQLSHATPKAVDNAMQRIRRKLRSACC